MIPQSLEGEKVAKKLSRLERMTTGGKGPTAKEKGGERGRTKAKGGATAGKEEGDLGPKKRQGGGLPSKDRQTSKPNRPEKGLRPIGKRRGRRSDHSDVILRKKGGLEKRSAGSSQEKFAGIFFRYRGSQWDFGEGRPHRRGAGIQRGLAQ